MRRSVRYRPTFSLTASQACRRKAARRVVKRWSARPRCLRRHLPCRIRASRSGVASLALAGAFVSVRVALHRAATAPNSPAWRLLMCACAFYERNGRARRTVEKILKLCAVFCFCRCDAQQRTPFVGHAAQAALGNGPASVDRQGLHDIANSDADSLFEVRCGARLRN